MCHEHKDGGLMIENKRRDKGIVGIGSDSDCLLRQLKRIFETSDSDAGLKVEKSGGEAGGEGQCGDAIWRDEKKFGFRGVEC